MKFNILIYGCQMNYADSARIKTVLENCGWEYVESIDHADIVIFDSCSVRQKAEDKITWKLKSIPKTKKIWITGCMTGHYLKSYLGKKMVNGNFQWYLEWWNYKILGLEDNVKEHIYRNNNKISDLLPINNAFNPLFKKLHKTFPNLELMFRIDDVAMLPYILDNIGYWLWKKVEIFENYLSITPRSTNALFLSWAKTSYVPIGNWCSHFCSYCIVPFARWLERFRPIDEIIKEVKVHLWNNVSEIVFLWQIVNKHPEFVNILKETLKLDWLKRLRYTSPYPTLYSDEIFALHENEEKLCPHIHMPLQSWSNEVLKRMNRGYTLDVAKEFIDKTYALKRGISLTTDIIVGFPDETDQDFQQTLDLVNYWKFDMQFIWIYSERPRTLAARKYPDNIPAKIKRQRREVLTKILKETSLANNQKEIGLIKDMMVTSYENKQLVWYDERMKNVIVNYPFEDWKEKVWNYQKVKIIDGWSLKIFGEIIK